MTVLTAGKRAFRKENIKKTGAVVLAGLITSLIAQGTAPCDAAILAVYLHGAAGDALTKEYSAYGVRPDDLPREIARQAARLRP